MAQIRQEINILDHQITGSIAGSNERVQLDTSQYNGTVTYYFEILASTSSGTPLVNLQNLTKGLTDKQLTISGGSTLTLYRGSFTPDVSAGTPSYNISASDTTVTIKSARIVIIQNATTLTNTETQIEIGNYNLTRTAESATILTNPKYWKYDASKWDGTKTFYAEAVYDSGDMDTISVYLYTTSDILAPSWSSAATIVSAATTTAPTRTRVAFTPVDGNWYTIFSLNGSMDNHDIYRAGIVVDQRAPANESQTTLSDTYILQGGTAGSGETSQAQGQSFTTVSAYSLAGITLYSTRVSSPTDNLVITVYSGSINGSLIGTSDNVPGASISNAGQFITFYFSTPISLANSTKYYFQINRSGARDTSNCWTFARATTSAYASGGWYLRDNNVWAAESATIDSIFETHTSVGITKLEPQYLLANTLFRAGTALQTFLTDWDSTEWTGVTNTYYFQAEAANGSTSDVTLEQADGGGTVTNSTLTNIDNAQISSAMTMPGDENLDTTATTNAGDVAAARILVTVSVDAATAATIPFINTIMLGGTIY